MPPDEPTDEERQEELANDSQTPFQPAANAAQDDASSSLAEDNNPQSVSNSSVDDTHPATDTNIDPHENYDEGGYGATETKEPNEGNAVVDYNEPGDDPSEK